MRRLLVCLVAAPALLAVTACVRQDPAPLFVDMTYQVRCVDCTPRSVDDAPHAIAALNGEDGFAVSCRVQRPGKDRLVSFSATFKDAKHSDKNYSIKIRQADLDRADPGAGCLVDIAEGANTYEGTCTSGDPADDKPCQLKLSAKDGIVKGSLFCVNIPNRSENSLTRHIVSPDSTDPASFEVHGCVGL